MDRSILSLKGVGPARAHLLAQLGIATVDDLLSHLPSGYLDRSRIRPIASATPGMEAVLLGEVGAITLRKGRRGREVLSAEIEDESGVIRILCFGRPYLKRQLLPGLRVLVAGRVRFYDGPCLVNPDLEILDPSRGAKESRVGGRILPVYPATEGLSQKTLRGLMERALDDLTERRPEFLPETVLRRHDLPGLTEAFRQVHFPASTEGAARGRRRLTFDEFLCTQLLFLRGREQNRSRGTAPILKADPGVRRSIAGQMGFPLTGAQDRVVDEILADLGADRPMMRLLQGDVGAGKTVVAAIACAAAHSSEAQACLMAPTEVLAAQHARTLDGLLSPTGCRVALLMGRTPSRERSQILRALAAGQVDCLVGTHAILEEDVVFARLGLVVVDEQHRFGVVQRLRLGDKAPSPHTLVMSATPIPRTLALALYGDLDVSTLDEIPPGRTTVRTRLVDRSRWDAMLRFIADRLRRGQQAFFVYPLVAESVKTELRDATRMHELIKGHASFRDLRVGLLHGRMPAAEREKVLESMRNGRIHAIVTTTVIEVGIDLPRATIMVIEHPERFGLSQLHQLRGRIGRAPGEDPYLFLIRPEDEPASVRDRLRVLVGTHDGFAIAEADLRLRGPGERCGTRQSGLPGMRVADPIRDRSILLEAREAAGAILRSDPGLQDLEHRPLWLEVSRRFHEGVRLLGVA